MLNASVGTKQSPANDFYLGDEMLKKRHELSKPPKEAYLFLPSSFEIVEYEEKNPKRTLRRIFEGKNFEFLNFEEQKFQELIVEIAKFNNKNKTDKCEIPTDYKKDEIRRFLQATGYNHSKTIDLLKENFKWRRELIPPQISSKTVEILNCGFMYIHGRDCNYRPIMVLNANVYMKLKDKYTFEDWVSSVIFIMEYTITNLLIPGQVENWNIITDLNGVSLVFLPSDMKKIMGILQSNYRCRLYVNYLLGMGAFLRGIWKIIQGMLDETTVRKIRILEDKTMSDMFTFINEEQVEQRFGGKAENTNPGLNNLFPPLMPSINFLKNGQVPEKVLISEGIYKELHKSGKLTKTGDYYLRKWEADEKMAEQLEKIEEENAMMRHKSQGQSNINLKKVNFIVTKQDEELHKSKTGMINIPKNNCILDVRLFDILENEINDDSRYKLNELKNKLNNSRSNTKEVFRKKSIQRDRSPDILSVDKKSLFSEDKTSNISVILRQNGGESKGNNTGKTSVLISNLKDNLPKSAYDSDAHSIENENEKIIKNFDKRSESVNLNMNEGTYTSGIVTEQKDETVFCRGCAIY